jgi:GNAT superfamily N-acetyltransferase
MAALKFKLGVGVFSQALLYDDGYLTDVYTHPFARRKGYASRVMLEVCRYADKHGVTMNIHIHKYGKGGACKAVLAEFYARFGFSMCGTCAHTMVRKHKKLRRGAQFDPEVVQTIVAG